MFGEYVSLRELGLATLVTGAMAFAGYCAGPALATVLGVGVFAGQVRVLAGIFSAFAGFLLSVLLTRPKRVVEEG